MGCKNAFLPRPRRAGAPVGVLRTFFSLQKRAKLKKLAETLSPSTGRAARFEKLEIRVLVKVEKQNKLEKTALR